MNGERRLSFLRQKREREAQDRQLIRRTLQVGETWHAAMQALHVGLSHEVPHLLYELWSEGKIGTDLSGVQPPFVASVASRCW